MKFDLGTFEINEEASIASSHDETEERIWSDKEKVNWSDWTILVSCKNESKSHDSEETADDNNQITYYVHRSQLASGKRKSEYFRRLFQTTSTIESMNHTSNITFENSSSLTAFPIMLDYLYSSSKDYIQFTTETATALRYLSTYFLISDLFDDINRFIQGDMKINTNVEIYLQEAYEYKDEKLLHAASKFINEKFDIHDVERILSLPTDVLLSGCVETMVCKLAENFELVEVDQVLGIPLELLKVIVTSPSFAYESKRLSITIYEYIKMHAIEDTKVIHTLTNSEIMPSIDPSCALGILDVIEGLTVGRSNLVYKSLFNRCIESITSNWKDVLVQSSDQPSSINKKDCGDTCSNGDYQPNKYENISPVLMNSILLMGLATAKRNYEELVVSSQKKYDNLVELFQLLLVVAQKENALKS